MWSFIARIQMYRTFTRVKMTSKLSLRLDFYAMIRAYIYPKFYCFRNSTPFSVNCVICLFHECSVIVVNLSVFILDFSLEKKLSNFSRYFYFFAFCNQTSFTLNAWTCTLYDAPVLSELQYSSAHHFTITGGASTTYYAKCPITILQQ